MSDHPLESNLALQDSTQHPAPGEGYWYMAGPYSDNIMERYKEHLALAALLTKRKLTVYAPIIHYHDMAQTYNMPTDAEFWNEHNRHMIFRSRGVILLCFPNWAQSKGVRKELDYSKMIGCPVWALDPPPTYQGDEVTLNWTRLL
jgi:hypothetical protein